MATRRAELLTRLNDEFDLLVIGGGVNGLGVAWDAADRGLKVLVIDKGDWGSGTSSWSSRMVHGGLKYLEKLEVGLVRESLRDREWLLQRAPHLVTPLPFFMPFYRDNAHHWIKLRAGMILYDLLSFDKSLPNHRAFSLAKTLERVPGLSQDGLQGSARYFDAQVVYAERMSLELMLAAREAGAVPINYLSATGLTVENGRVVGASLADTLTGAPYEVRARFVVNVTGPWVDDVLAGSAAGSERLIGGTKGTHLVVEPFEGAPQESLYYEAVADGRPLMVIPWLGKYLIGSTDKRFSGDLDMAAADSQEIDYIIAETNRVFPNANLTAGSALYCYTGVRPLPYAPSGKEGDVTRKHILKDHRPVLDGMISIVGGKLTTFRTLAEHTVDAVSERLGVKSRSRTRGLDFPGKPEQSVDEFRSAFVFASGLDEATANRLVTIYGSRAEGVAALVSGNQALGEVIDEASGLIAAEVIFAVREEEGMTVGDVLSRRTMVGLAPDLGQNAVDSVSELMATELGWDADEIASQKKSYRHYLTRFLEPEQ